MASTSEIWNDMHAELPAPHARPPSRAASAANSEMPPRVEEIGQNSRDIPKIFDLEWQKEGMPDTEFNRKYPPDAWGEEMAPNARVWKIYRDQQNLSHSGMLQGWNKTLDVLLIFAGLFSAVLTAFLIESYKSLQPDYTQYVATFLHAAAMQHDRTGAVFPALDVIGAPDRFIQTSAAQRWTNGLWFFSLVISLSVALLCILIKQWLEEYDAHISSETAFQKYWAQRHCMYYRGLKSWGVPGLISLLPFLLHISLFLFFAGLILFLRPLDGAISCSLLVMVSSIAMFYILSLVLPAWRVECPSYTPLTVQALLPVSRAMYSLFSGVMTLKSLASTPTQDFQWAEEDEEPQIQLHASEQLAREASAISTRGMDLDGYVLSSLINLPSDTNRDVVHTATIAVGAVTSSRTIAAISRNVPHDVFEEKISACYSNIHVHIFEEETGFTITSHAQLRRADRAMCSQNPDTRRFRQPSRFNDPQLGIDDVLLIMLEVGPRFHVNRLLPQLQSLLPANYNSRGFPLRSTCLAFLDRYAEHILEHPSYLIIDRGSSLLSCFLLVFCAGRFESADTHERLRALRSTQTVLNTACGIPMPAHRDEEKDSIYAVINRLWIMLADYMKYGIDTVTAEILAHQALVYIHTLSSSGVAWSQLDGISTFVRSPTFDKCVGASLSAYIKEFSYTNWLGPPLEGYWGCIATLYKLTLDRKQPYGTASLCAPGILFPVEPPDWNIRSRLNIGSPYASQDDWYEPALSAFLGGPNAVATWTWTAASPSVDDDDHIDELADLAHRISIVLCRRQRLGRANDTFVPAFFTGPFLLARFRDYVSRQHPISQPVFRAGERKFSYDEAVDDLAKHCLKLSPERLMALCAQLEGTSDADSEVRSRAGAFAQRIRDGSTPGGALSAECNAECACMLPAARAPTSKPTCWDTFVARLRRGRTEPATHSNV